MIKRFFFNIASFLLVLSVCHAQSAKFADCIKPGGLLYYKMYDYSFALKPVPKSKRPKEAELEELKEQFNSKVRSKEMKTTSTAISFSIGNCFVQGDTSVANYTMEMDTYGGGTNTKYRQKGAWVMKPSEVINFQTTERIYAVGSNKDTLGWAALGAIHFPRVLNEEVGLPAYEDYYLSFPSYDSYRVYKKEIDKVSASSGIENVKVTNFDISKPLYTTEKAIVTRITTSYKTVPKEVSISANLSQFAFKHAATYMKEKKEVTISGVTYSAYVYICEAWYRTTVDLKVKADDPEVEKQQQKLAKKTEKRINNGIEKYMGSNLQGYNVVVTEEWIVPELGGSVKSFIYDPQGYIKTAVILEETGK